MRMSWVLVSVVLSTSLPAYAARVATVADAEGALAEGEFEKALKVADQALARRPVASERLRLQQVRAQCFLALKRGEKAEGAMREVLIIDPEFKLSAEQSSPAFMALFQKVRATTLGELSVETTPPGANVTLDGEILGPSPLSTTAPVGRHRVEATLAGHAAQVEEVVIRHDQLRTVQLTLTPGSGARATAPSKPAPGLPEGQVLTRVPGQEPWRPWLWRGGVTLGVGLVFVLWANGIEESIRSGEGYADLAAVQRAAGTGRVVNVLGMVGVVGGLVGLGIAGVGWLQDGPTVAVVPTPGGAALAVQGVLP
jgi:hypothetical protein